MELKTRAKVIRYYRSTEISICRRIYFVVNRHKQKKHLCIYNHKFAVTDLSLSVNRAQMTPRIFLINMAALWEEIDLFISYLPSNSGYDVMLLIWVPAMTWFGTYALYTETEWRGMFISNRYCRYKVSFVVQCRYATWREDFFPVFGTSQAVSSERMRIQIS